MDMPTAVTQNYGVTQNYFYGSTITHHFHKYVLKGSLESALRLWDQTPWVHGLVRWLS